MNTAVIYRALELNAFNNNPIGRYWRSCFVCFSCCEIKPTEEQWLMGRPLQELGFFCLFVCFYWWNRVFSNTCSGVVMNGRVNMAMCKSTDVNLQPAFFCTVHWSRICVCFTPEADGFLLSFQTNNSQIFHQKYFFLLLLFKTRFVLCCTFTKCFPAFFSSLNIF